MRPHRQAPAAVAVHWAVGVRWRRTPARRAELPLHPHKNGCSSMQRPLCHAARAASTAASFNVFCHDAAGTVFPQTECPTPHRVVADGRALGLRVTRKRRCQRCGESACVSKAAARRCSKPSACSPVFSTLLTERKPGEVRSQASGPSLPPAAASYHDRRAILQYRFHN